MEMSLKMHTSRIANRTLLLVVAFAVMMGSGCSALTGRSKGPLDNLDPATLKMAGYTQGVNGLDRPMIADNGEDCIILDITNGKRQLEKLPLQPGQSLFVGDVIRDANLYKKIGRVKVSVLRPNGKNLPPVRMDVDFDDSGKNVMEGQNYSLRAGDHVIVRPDDRTGFANFLTGR